MSRPRRYGRRTPPGRAARAPEIPPPSTTACRRAGAGHPAAAAPRTLRRAAAADPDAALQATNACCSDVKSRRASSSVAAANTSTPSMTCGRSSAPKAGSGRGTARGLVERRPAQVRGEGVRQAELGREAAPNRSSRGSRRHRRARPRARPHELARMGGPRSTPCSSTTSCGKRVGAAGRGAAPTAVAGRCPARGRGRGRSARDRARRGCRIAPRSRAARDSAA